MRYLRRKFTKIMAVLLVAVLCLGMVQTVAFASTNSTETISITGVYDYDRAYEVLDLVNGEREAEGLNDLELDDDLMEAAMQRAAEVSLYFSSTHTRPNGTTCFTISSKASGENCARWALTAEGAMSLWMNSDGHRANILGSSYKSMGVGCFHNGTYGYWVQIFSTQESSGVTERETYTGTAEVELSLDIFGDALYMFINNVDDEGYVHVDDADKDYIQVGNSEDMVLKIENPGDNAYTRIDNGGFYWTSSNSSVATVDQSGTVTAISPGSVTITATSASGGLTASKELQIISLDAPVLLSAESQGNSYIYVTWTSVDGAASYAINWTCDGKTLSPTQEATSGDTQTYRAHPTSVAAGTEITYSVQAIDSEGRYGEESNKITVVYEKNGHDWNSGVVTTAATCGAEGVKTYTCKVCGQTKTEAIAATGNHTWNSGVVTKAATSTTTGIRTYTCKVCGETKTETIAKTSGSSGSISSGSSSSGSSRSGSGSGSGSSSAAPNGVCKASDGNWYYYKNGVKQTSYTGFASNSHGQWYIEKGKVTFKTNGVIKDDKGAIGSKNTWYYVVGSKVQTSYTGVADYKNKNGWWYIKNGKVDFTYNGVAKNKNGWWYVLGGKVQFDFTGLGNYGNSNGWWYIKNGKVDFSHNGVEKNKNGWWYVVGGKVQFGYTGVANYKNANGWWYIKNGKVDFTANTVAKNNNGWWYVKGGKVQFGYTGIGHNSNGYWYCKNGKVQFGYTGTIKSGGKSYQVTKGKVKM